MSLGDAAMVAAIERRLSEYSESKRALPGVRSSGALSALAMQIKDSTHRVRYFDLLSDRDLSPQRANPANVEMFHPLKAAIARKREGDLEEAYWLLFLYVHFGKSRALGWKLARDVYSGRSGAVYWSWRRTSSDVLGFRRWLSAYVAEIKARGERLGFGNHRKFQSLDAQSDSGTGAAVASYVAWASERGSHSARFDEAIARADNQPAVAFDLLFQSMRSVKSFGRLARFDYLSAVGKVHLAAIEPGSTYMAGATGPTHGARLLFGGETTSPIPVLQLEDWLKDMAAVLELGAFSMQILEDALCNWQKSPDEYTRFAG
jgi:hypothetical protein